MNTENLSTLKIHKLTQAQYDRELNNGDIDENALYLTPDDTEVLIDELNIKKVNVSDIADNLTTNSATKILSAAQGVAIKETTDNLQTSVDDHENRLAALEASVISVLSGATEPASNIGEDGDIYLVTG